MSQKGAEAANLLVKWIPHAEMTTSLRSLAQKLGEWPLLLELVGGHLRDYVLLHGKSLEQAITTVHRWLDRRGFTAFDGTSEEDRNQAISLSFELSLEQLDKRSAQWYELDNWRKRYLELAIFPEDLEIPFETIFKLWQQTAGFDEFSGGEALFGMASLSLFTQIDGAAQTVRLHDVIRALIASKQANLAALHGQLLDGYGPFTEWANPSRRGQPPGLSPRGQPPGLPLLYPWHYLAYHLQSAGRVRGTGNCLTSFNFDEALAACAFGEGNRIVVGGESGQLHLLRLLPSG